MTPLKGGENPPDGCYNYGMILSAEESINGFVYPKEGGLVYTGDNVDDLGQINSITANPYTATNPPFGINYTEVPGNASLAHVFLPTGNAWNNGDNVWNISQATEWMQRVRGSGGAFTWNVRRSGCNGCNGTNIATIDPDDLAFLTTVFDRSGSVAPPYAFDGGNCDCLRPSPPGSNAMEWGCENPIVVAQCENDPDWRGEFNGKLRDCDFVCRNWVPSDGGAPPGRCSPTFFANGEDPNGYCNYCCKTCCADTLQTCGV